MSSPDDDHATQRYILKNGLELIVRRASAEDAEQVISYVEQIAGESENITIGPGEFDIGLEEERAFLQKCRESVAGLLYLVAEIDAEIVGTLSLRPGSAHVLNMLVSLGPACSAAIGTRGLEVVCWRT